MSTGLRLTEAAVAERLDGPAFLAASDANDRRWRRLRSRAVAGEEGAVSLEWQVGAEGWGTRAGGGRSPARDNERRDTDEAAEHREGRGAGVRTTAHWPLQRVLRELY